MPFPQTNRNLAIYDRLIIDNGADDFIYALDAVTGAQVWETKILDYRKGAKQSSGPIIADGLAITRDCVAEIAALATRLGARTAVVLMPARFQVDDGDYGRLRDAVRQAGGELVRDAASERFDAALRTLPVPTLDVLPALRAATPGPDLFFQETVHLTPRGHEVVAAALDGFLEQTGLAPADAPPARR